MSRQRGEGWRKLSPFSFKSCFIHIERTVVQMGYPCKFETDVLYLPKTRTRKSSKASCTVVVHENRKKMLKALKLKNGFGFFFPSKSGTKNVGTIHLDHDNGCYYDVIVHEATHAAFHLAKIAGVENQKGAEEFIAIATGQIAGGILTELRNWDMAGVLARILKAPR